MYNISQGQLRIVIICLALLWIVSLVNTLDAYSPSAWAVFGTIVIPFAGSFYWLGWRSKHGVHVSKSPEGGRWVSRINHFMKSKFIYILLIVFAISGVNIALSIYNDFTEKRELANEYVGNRARLGQLIANSETCIQESVNSLLPKLKSQCSEKYLQAKANYDDCRRNLDWFSHNECLNWRGSNYEAINCQDEKLVQDARSASSMCQNLVLATIQEINNYEQNIVEEFLSSLPVETSFISDEQAKSLYKKIPSNFLDEKTKNRLHQLITDKGYSLNELAP